MTSSPSASENVWCPRVTVACVVSDGDRYLMVEEEVYGELAYNQPAGHLDPGESLQAACVREALEETGHTVQLDAFLGVWQWVSAEHGEQVLRFAFSGRSVSCDTQRALDSGIVRALWLPRADIESLGPRLRSPLIVQTIDAFESGRRLPLDAVTSLLPEVRA